MTEKELEERLDKIQEAAENNDGYGCGTILIVGLLLYIIHLLGGC